MAIGEGRTVSILGAGFSKPLGGPLLADLFRQEAYDNLAELIGESRAAQLTGRAQRVDSLRPGRPITVLVSPSLSLKGSSEFSIRRK